MTKRYYVGE